MILLVIIGFTLSVLPFVLYFLDFRGKKTIIAISAIVAFFALIILLKTLLVLHPYAWTLFILVIPLLFVLKAILKPQDRNIEIEHSKSSELLDD